MRGDPQDRRRGCRDGAIHTRNTLSMPFRHASSVSGAERSPRTNSTSAGRLAERGLRLMARIRQPVPRSCDTTS
jgi:hypothetical protein